MQIPGVCGEQELVRQYGVACKAVGCCIWTILVYQCSPRLLLQAVCMVPANHFAGGGSKNGKSCKRKDETSHLWAEQCRLGMWVWCQAHRRSGSGTDVLEEKQGHRRNGLLQSCSLAEVGIYPSTAQECIQDQCHSTYRCQGWRDADVCSIRLSGWSLPASPGAAGLVLESL